MRITLFAFTVFGIELLPSCYGKSLRRNLDNRNEEMVQVCKGRGKEYTILEIPLQAFRNTDGLNKAGFLTPGTLQHNVEEGI